MWPRAGSPITRPTSAWIPRGWPWAAPARAAISPPWSASWRANAVGLRSSSSSSSIPSPTLPSTHPRRAPSPPMSIRSTAPTWSGSGATTSATRPTGAIRAPPLPSPPASPAFPPPSSSRRRSIHSATRASATRRPSRARASPPPTHATTASPTASWEWRPLSTRHARRWRSAPAPCAKRSAGANSPSPCPLPLRGRGYVPLSLPGGRGQGEGGANSLALPRGRDLHAAESPELHLARRKPTRLAQVSAGRHVDGDVAAVLRLGVTCGECGGETQRVQRQSFEALGIAHDHVRAGAGRHVKPCIARLAQLEGEQIVVRRGAAHEHDEAVRRDEAARHRAALPDPLLGVGDRWIGPLGHISRAPPSRWPLSGDGLVCLVLAALPVVLECSVALAEQIAHASAVPLELATVLE